MLTKSTFVFAHHQLPLECDVYECPDYPATSPVVLFFHSGGLVGGARQNIPPWLIQACLRRQWPLVSPSYRLLPQAGASGLLQDVTAAYEFSRNLGSSEPGRKVIVAGASAGFFLAALTAHHLTPPPLALLSITGISTFRHPFFNSSVLLTPEPITDDEMKNHISAPASVGGSTPGDATAFSLDKLLPSGAKNPDYKTPAATAAPATDEKYPRGCLYDYYLYKNSFVELLGSIDPGYEWAKQDAEKLSKWPPTVLIQGDDDEDVAPDVSFYMVNSLGSDKANLCVGKGEGHLFEATNFLEDSKDSMDAVREAISHLDRIVA